MAYTELSQKMRLTGKQPNDCFGVALAMPGFVVDFAREAEAMHDVEWLPRDRPQLVEPQAIAG